MDTFDWQGERDGERVSNKKKVDADSLEAYEVIFSRVWFCIWLVMLFKAIAAAIHLFQRGAAGHEIDSQRVLNQWRCNGNSNGIGCNFACCTHFTPSIHFRFSRFHSISVDSLCSGPAPSWNIRMNFHAMWPSIERTQLNFNAANRVQSQLHGNVCRW